MVRNRAVPQSAQICAICVICVICVPVLPLKWNSPVGHGTGHGTGTGDGNGQGTSMVIDLFAPIPSRFTFPRPCGNVTMMSALSCSPMPRWAIGGWAEQ